MHSVYDVVIVGCGPAGLTAAIYCARANKKVLILEKETIGGQMSSAPLIENYPGFNSISGSELANYMYEQVVSLGVNIELEEVKEIKVADKKTVVTEDNEYETNAVIIATGSKYRLLGLENEEQLIGNGIHFCVSCDGAFYKNKTVAVIGGGNSAVINALALSELCQKVYLVQNLSKLTAEQILIDKLNSKSNIEIYASTTVKRIVGDAELEKIILDKNSVLEELIIDGMFVSIGLIPQTDSVKNILDINDYGYITAENCISKIPGIFVAGDCRDKKVKQVTVAVSDGTIAAINAIEYLNN
ncbi:MAG: FAD-dependent oxidoreductase [Firmicutes bacterium]|nr:FAD-dependent oxidoreductase [Bacillota bacterium]